MDSTTQVFQSGCANLLQNEDIPYDASQDELGFVTMDGKEVLVGGRINIGTEGTLGQIRGLWFGYTNNGTLVMYRKTETTIDYLNGSTWTSILTSLTSGSEASFANLSNPFGSFTFICTIDGLWKINNAYPAFPMQMYSSLKNYHGRILIDQGRMILWARNDPSTTNYPAIIDNTGIYVSNPDITTIGGATLVQNEIVATGDGTTKTFSGVLNVHNFDSLADFAGIQINAPTGGVQNVTNITLIPNTYPPQQLPLTAIQLTVASHGYSQGNTVELTGFLASNTGTGTITSSAQSVSGSGTAFTTQLKVGTTITTVNGSAIVLSIGSDTSLTLTQNATLGSGVAFTYNNISQINGVAVPITSIVDGNNFQISPFNPAFPVGTIFTPYSSGGQVTKCEILLDDTNGNLKSSAGSTGTINYVTGAYTFTLINALVNSVTALASYYWEDSNVGGITDFSINNSGNTGFIIPEDTGGDAIEKILIGQDGNYYTMKQHSVYVWNYTVASTGSVSFTNSVYYQNMGLASPNSAVSTKLGIIFLNVANPLKPEMTLLQKDPVGDAVIPVLMFTNFKFANYDFTDSYMDTWERYIIFSCKQQSSTNNDRILLMNPSKPQSVDIQPYNARMFTKDSSDNLYVGSPIIQSVYNIFSGFDDMGFPINAYWISNGSKYGNLNSRSLKWRFIQEELKRARRLRVRGYIQPNQAIQVYLQPDDGGFTLIGTILGTGSYVDNNDVQIIGKNFIGNNVIGGGVSATNVYAYFWEMKMPPGKFRKRALKFVPLNIGYFDFAFVSDWNIELFEARLPKRFRQNAVVSTAGTPATTLGVELLINPNFTGNANNWNLGTNWAYGNNNVTFTG